MYKFKADCDLLITGVIFSISKIEEFLLSKTVKGLSDLKLSGISQAFFNLYAGMVSCCDFKIIFGVSEFKSTQPDVIL